MISKYSEFAGHDSQYVFPASSWYLPSSHSVQFAESLSAEYQPAPQSRHAMALMYRPGAHDGHTPSEPNEQLCLRIPFGHDIHALQVLAPISSWYLPGSHR